jgi:hypothetical protein
MALDILTGKIGEQYKHVREYANAIMKWNPGISAYIQQDGQSLITFHEWGGAIALQT